MLVLKIEMWPGGVEANKYPHGEIRITNVGGNKTSADYKIELFKSPKLSKTGGIWKTGRVFMFPRQKLGNYDLLLRGLIACCGARSAGDVASIRKGDTAHFPDDEKEPLP